MKIHEVLEATPDSIIAPFHVVLSFGKNAERILFAGKQVSLGEDFRGLEEQRMTIAWYVDQLGGKVKWEK